MRIETQRDLDEYMDRLSERLYEIAAPAITPEQLRAVWETLRLVGDVTTDLFNRLQKERDSATAAESARKVCAMALKRANAESEELREIRDRLSDELADMRRERDGKPAKCRDCELGEGQPTDLGLRVQNYYKEGQLRDIAAEAERALQTIEMLRHDVGPNGLVDLLERRVRFIKGMAE